jgi:hypothetical protein
MMLRQTRRASKSRGSGICDHRAWRRRTTCGINRLKGSVAALLQPAILQPPTFGALLPADFLRHVSDGDRGVTARITDSIYLYGEYDYANSDKVRIPWAVDAGLRWAW